MTRGYRKVSAKEVWVPCGSAPLSPSPSPAALVSRKGSRGSICINQSGHNLLQSIGKRIRPGIENQLVVFDLCVELRFGHLKLLIGHHCVIALIKQGK
jgi:hypothetical protein